MEVPHENGEEIHSLSLNPLEIMPPEMWDKILRMLGNDPTELLSVSKTCLLFQDLIADKLNGCRLEQVLPLVLQWLPKTEILHCRMTCKRILSCVNGLLGSLELVGQLQNLSLYRKLERSPLSRRIPVPASVNRGRLQVPDIMMSMNTRADSTNRFRRWSFYDKTEDLCLIDTGRAACFRGRSLRIWHLQELEKENLKVEHYLDLLHRSLYILRRPVFTNWIEFLELDGNYEVTDATKMYQTILELYHCLPNLKAFSIKICLESNVGWTSEAHSELSTYMSCHPLPEMEKLKHISLQGSCPLDVFVDLCCRYGRQLKSLDMNIEDPLNVYVGYHHCPLPVLNSLRITRRLSSYELPLPNIHAAQVKYLELDIGYINTKWCQEAPFLTKFPNLKTLVIWNRVPVNGVLRRITSFCQRFQLGRFPNIKHLQLRGILFFDCSMKRIVRAFPKLESLVIEFSCSDAHRWPEVAQKCEEDWNLLREKRGYELKIWKLKSFKSFRVSCSGRDLSATEQFGGHYIREILEGASCDPTAPSPKKRSYFGFGKNFMSKNTETSAHSQKKTKGLGSFIRIFLQ